MHARELRPPYVAAELRNPIVYAYMVNGPEAGIFAFWDRFDVDS